MCIIISAIFSPEFSEMDRHFWSTRLCLFFKSLLLEWSLLLATRTDFRPLQSFFTCLTGLAVSRCWISWCVVKLTYLRTVFIGFLYFFRLPRFYESEPVLWMAEDGWGGSNSKRNFGFHLMKFSPWNYFLLKSICSSKLIVWLVVFFCVNCSGILISTKIPLKSFLYLLSIVYKADGSPAGFVRRYRRFLKLIWNP